ncbi:MAG: YegP family protein [Cyanobacteria bacterium P01_H01_bin.74]
MGKFYFVMHAQGRLLGASVLYTTTTGRDNGIRSVRENAAVAGVEDYAGEGAEPGLNRVESNFEDLIHYEAERVKSLVTETTPQPAEPVEAIEAEAAPTPDPVRAEETAEKEAETTIINATTDWELQINLPLISGTVASHKGAFSFRLSLDEPLPGALPSLSLA